jgi:hypothetical protein
VFAASWTCAVQNMGVCVTDFQYNCYEEQKQLVATAVVRLPALLPPSFQYA